jgi:hypothetical protein
LIKYDCECECIDKVRWISFIFLVSFSINWWLCSKINSCFDDEKDIYFLNNCHARVLALQKLPITRNLDLPSIDLKDSLVYRLNSNMLLWKLSNKILLSFSWINQWIELVYICIKSKSFKYSNLFQLSSLVVCLFFFSYVFL